MDQIAELVDELMYRSYKSNRDTSPNINYSRWNALYGPKNACLMEIRYLRENELLAPGVRKSDLDRWVLRSE